LYSGPFDTHAGAQVTAVAIRVGYRQSQVAQRVVR
jgi:hypothetical protein